MSLWFSSLWTPHALRPYIQPERTRRALYGLLPSLRNAVVLSNAIGDTTPPTYLGATINPASAGNTILDVQCSEALKAGTSYTNGVTIQIDGVTTAPSSAVLRAAPNNDTIRYTMPAAISADSTATWAYVAASGQIADVAGNLLANVSTQTATNSSTTHNTQSAAFDGTDDFASVGNNALLSITASLTVSGWLYLPALPGNDLFFNILTRHDGTVTGYILDIRNLAGAHSWGFFLDGQLQRLANTLPTAAWFHFAAVHDAVNDLNTYYINGSSVGTVGSATTDASASTLPLQLGRFDATVGRYLAGHQKGIRLWNVPVSAANVAKEALIANMGLKPSQISGWDTANAADANLIGLWNSEPPWTNGTVNTANQINDTSGNGLHATGANFAGTTASGVDTSVPS